jgi:hypothetical protein
MHEQAKGPLALWFATPLSKAEAEHLWQQATERHERRLRRGCPSVLPRLQQLCARFWLEQTIENDYQQLRIQFQHRHSKRAQALLELCHGQLLISRGLEGARKHLQQGFTLARELFAAGDYFIVHQRHQLLAQLPLSSQAGPAQELTQLLSTARVIIRMQQSLPRRGPYQHDPNDTYG